MRALVISEVVVKLVKSGMDNYIKIEIDWELSINNTSEHLCL